MLSSALIEPWPELEGSRAKVLKDGLARQERACDVLREASQVFQGARRRVAESVLGGIEAEANGRLADAGVELGMAVRWAREAKGLLRCLQPRASHALSKQYAGEGLRSMRRRPRPQARAATRGGAHRPQWRRG